MPLSTGKSNSARQENVEREIAAGKDPKQAVAIAYAQQRMNRSNDAAEIKSIYDKFCEVVGKMKG